MNSRFIYKDASLLQTLKKMDVLDKKLLIVEEDGNFVGLISAGDIQRAIIRNLPLDTKIIEVMRPNLKIGRPSDSFEKLKAMMLEYRMELCPIVSEDNKIVKVYYWEDVFGDDRPSPAKKFNLPVVIMAGGYGTRLKPLTNVLPKPLIPIGDKTMLEEIFERFNQHGSDRFFISINYKAELIQFYINQLNLDFDIQFFIEEKPLGTAGSLGLLKDTIHETFFVSNCDILVEQDYSEILDYHRDQGNDITIVAALKHFPIAYGTLETGEKGRLLNLVEKPDLTFLINSGMYILEPHMLDEIPEDQFFHITHLIEAVMEKGGNVGVFPVSEKSWKDIGEWDVYLKNYVNR